jgi:hypothetical protein
MASRAAPAHQPNSFMALRNVNPNALCPVEFANIIRYPSIQLNLPANYLGTFFPHNIRVTVVLMRLIFR